MGGALDHTATFRQEAADLLVQLEGALLDLADRPGDRDLVDTVFRALHTLKGSGAMFGFDALASFAHDMESAFDCVRNGKLAVGAELVNLTLAALDHIRALVDSPGTADQVRGDVLRASFRELTGTGFRAESRGDAPASTGGLRDGEDRTAATYRIRFRPGREVMRFGTNPLLLLDELRGLGRCAVTAITDDIPPLEDLDPTACYAAWDILLTSGRPQAEIEDVFIFVADQAALKIEVVLDPAEESAAKRVGEILVERGDIATEALADTLDKQERLGNLLVREGKVSPSLVKSALVEQRHLNRVAQGRPGAPSSAATGIRVPAERLDALMDQVGELVIAHARLAQAASAGEDMGLKSVAEEIGRLASGLRDTTMGIRMLPIGTLFGKFRRVVHDLSIELGKTVELTMSGEETELDKTVIENLNDPLIHLIRNAVDHGIEDAETRAARGKPPAGSVHLAAVHSGAQVLITISDDGGGMDGAAIRAKAEERGLLAPGQEASESELFALVFQPGFSTSQRVTGVSGRGVGMDVVKRAIDALRGTIDIASTPEQGSVITCRLPLTLAIIDGLLVRVGGNRYVIPLSAIEECVELTPGQDQRSGGRSFLNIRDAIVPFLRLRALFNDGGTAERFQKVVIVASGEERVGLVVDQVVGQYQTVIKSLSKLHREVREFSGATILGDGTVALILDVPHIVAFAQKREERLKAAGIASPVGEQE
ncbi:MAG: chemotaxis protein CheA [Alphaproteobacteria bacterium]|nr:chemotaxis protein CheA [Alphaproteobacteria bacterium]MBF0129809.1 chemotaxis protein CheA [Alphaproteobacteria bacterium]